MFSVLLKKVFTIKYDENVEAHLYLGLPAYQVIATIRFQLKDKGINKDWAKYSTDNEYPKGSHNNHENKKQYNAQD